MIVLVTSSVMIPMTVAKVNVPTSHRIFIRWDVIALTSPMTVTPERNSTGHSRSLSAHKGSNIHLLLQRLFSRYSHLTSLEPSHFTQKCLVGSGQKAREMKAILTGLLIDK